MSKVKILCPVRPLIPTTQEFQDALEANHAEMRDGIVQTFPRDEIRGRRSRFTQADYQRFIKIWQVHQEYWKELLAQRRVQSAEEAVAVMNEMCAASEAAPVRSAVGRWFYKGRCYAINPSYTDDEARLLLLDSFDRERRQFERLRHRYHSAGTSNETRGRSRIPESVRIEVWRRDSGSCARCGSRERIEYDHIVPRSRGGSDTARNVELLCEGCNRSKGNNIE